jgi:hypothetical protein
VSVGGWDASAEAEVFGRYLIGRDIDEDAVALYARALQSETYEGDDGERAVALFAVERPWSLGAIDGALALTRPRALLRRKLLLLTAILEASPHYRAEFFPARRSPWYAIAVACAMLRAVVQTAAGLVLLRFVR